HFHTDHPVFSCSKIEQKQLNTWVSFQSAEQPLLGQFSVSGNRRISRRNTKPSGTLISGHPHCIGRPWKKASAQRSHVKTSMPAA
ncbi:hypothetical protein, partial [Pseudomonas parasichuanensis]|uniref:hypothetical protein n=1 Tax=Pseudomonas parasichuanensis TaxID=2892329 RepID=UPI001F2D7561